jgi:hypothetical protein
MNVFKTSVELERNDEIQDISQRQSRKDLTDLMLLGVILFHILNGRTFSNWLIMDYLPEYGLFIFISRQSNSIGLGWGDDK